MANAASRPTQAAEHFLWSMAAQEIMLQGFRKSPASALRYLGMVELLVEEDMTAAVQARLPATQATEAIRLSATSQPADFL